MSTQDTDGDFVESNGEKQEVRREITTSEEISKGKKKIVEAGRPKPQIRSGEEGTSTTDEIESELVDEVHEPSQISKTKQKSLEFALIDYEQVHREIMDIKSCRTNIFIGTLGVLGALSIAILGILGASQSSSWQKWLPWAALIPVGLLTSSILATIHKARGINLRRGYMEALAEYLVNNKIPSYFCGWTKAKFILDRCKLHPGRIKVLENRVACPENPKEKSCIYLAKELTEKIVKRVKWRPDLLHSFTSLSTHIYALAYVVSIASLLLAVMSTIKQRIPTFSQKTYVIVCGAVITGIFAVIIIIAKHLTKRSRKRSGTNDRKDAQDNIEENKIEKFARKWFVIFGYFAGIIVTVFFLGLLYVQTKDVKDPWIGTVAYFFGGGISALALFIGYSFYDKVKSLRKGRYSYERWHQIWKICFERCPLMTTETPIGFQSN